MNQSISGRVIFSNAITPVERGGKRSLPVCKQLRVGELNAIGCLDAIDVFSETPQVLRLGILAGNSVFLLVEAIKGDLQNSTVNAIPLRSALAIFIKIPQNSAFSRIRIPVVSLPPYSPIGSGTVRQIACFPIRRIPVKVRFIVCLNTVLLVASGHPYVHVGEKPGVLGIRQAPEHQLHHIHTAVVGNKLFIDLLTGAERLRGIGRARILGISRDDRPHTDSCRQRLMIRRVLERQEIRPRRVGSIITIRIADPVVAVVQIPAIAQELLCHRRIVMLRWTRSGPISTLFQQLATLPRGIAICNQRHDALRREGHGRPRIQQKQHVGRRHGDLRYRRVVGLQKCPRLWRRLGGGAAEKQKRQDARAKSPGERRH